MRKDIVNIEEQIFFEQFCYIRTAINKFAEKC